MLRSKSTRISILLSSRRFLTILTVKLAHKRTRTATPHLLSSTIRGTASRKSTSMPCATTWKKSSFRLNREYNTSVGLKIAMSTQFLTAHALRPTSSTDRRRLLMKNTSNSTWSCLLSMQKEPVAWTADTYYYTGVPHRKAGHTTTNCRRPSSKTLSS